MLHSARRPTVEEHTRPRAVNVGISRWEPNSSLVAIPLQEAYHREAWVAGGATP